jgi:hypothetical protein
VWKGRVEEKGEGRREKGEGRKTKGKEGGMMSFKNGRLWSLRRMG